MLGMSRILRSSVALLVSIMMFSSYSQGGYFTYRIEVTGRQWQWSRGCDGSSNRWENDISYTDNLSAYCWGGALIGTPYGQIGCSAQVRFVIEWHGDQAPDPYTVIRYGDSAYLGLFSHVGNVGTGSASFAGNVTSGDISIRCLDALPCSTGTSFEGNDWAPYYLNFDQVEPNLWRASIQVPFQMSATVNGACWSNPPREAVTGSANIGGCVTIAPPKFVYIVAEEPTYRKVGNCVREENNTSGRLDDRYGDTAIELYAYRWEFPDLGHWTEWYLGHRMPYVQMRHGIWCHGDCPLNEWWICGAYYKDNLFHEFTGVEAIVGLPKSDCEKWYLGAELGWSDTPSAEFWQRKDVQERVREILSKLPFKYEVKLRLTDDYGNGFSDTANYTMIIHPEVELTDLLRVHRTYLPEEGRSDPQEFIPSESMGAFQLTDWIDNLSPTPASFTLTVEREFTTSTTFSWDITCIAGGEWTVSEVAKRTLEAKFGIGKTTTTSEVARIGQQFQFTILPYHRMALFAQLTGVVEEWLGDKYNRQGYQGTGRFKFPTNVHFTLVPYQIPIER